MTATQPPLKDEILPAHKSLSRDVCDRAQEPACEELTRDVEILSSGLSIFPEDLVTSY